MLCRLGIGFLQLIGRQHSRTCQYFPQDLIEETPLPPLTFSIKTTTTYPQSKPPIRINCTDEPQRFFNMSDPNHCGSCNKTASEANLTSLKACAKCKSVFYCNRDCQKSDWKTHKKVCAQNAGQNAAYGATPPSGMGSGLQEPPPNPFTRLDNGSYLHDRPEQDVYKLLIDCFRLRQEDNWTFERIRDPESLYTDASNSLTPFRHFLRLAASRPNLLPSWWNDAKKDECEAFGQRDSFSNLSKKTNKAEIMAYYQNPKMPMELRMLGEVIYQRGPGGQDGTGMRRMMMEAENRTSQGGGFHMSHLDMS